MSYTATNNVDDIDPTIPLGSDAPSTLDEADRETRLVLKTALKNAHTGLGCIRAAIWKQQVIAPVPSGTINQWNRRALGTILDPTSILGVGAFTNSIMPIAGTYLVRFWSQGFRLDGFMARLAQATGNTLAPSSSTEIESLLGNFGFSNNTANVMTTSQGLATLITDGTKSYCLDQRHAVLNATDGYGKAPTTGWTVNNSNVVAAVEFLLLGIVTA